MSTLATLFIVYAILLILVLLFAFRFARGQGDLEGEIEALKESESRDKGGESPPG